MILPRYNSQPDLVAEVARLSKRLSHLERVNQLPHSSVTRGDGTVVTVPELASGVAVVAPDGVAPATAPIVTFIGGIGAIHFKWTPVSNPTPVTYHLHVKAGSAPAIDGSNEVVSGVGLTAATVRKMTDDTPVVSDGSVTYYGIVTTNDIDGAGPPSAAVSGVPEQVTGPDIATNALTTAHLTANDAFIGALTGTDFSAVTMTGVTVETQEAPNRGVKMGIVGDVEGFWVFDGAGNPFLTAEPASGMAVVAGEVKATTQTVRDKSSLGGRTEITRATTGSPGQLVLTAYTTAPASAPTVTQGHDSVQFTNDGKWGSRVGWAFDGTYYFTYNSSSFKIEKWDASGTLVSESASLGTSAIVVYGMTCSDASTVTFLYADTRINANEYILYEYDSTVSPMTPVGGANLNAITAGTRRPTLGWDPAGSGGTGDYIIAQSRSTNADKIRFTRLDYITLNIISFIDTSTGYAKDLRGVYFGAADFGANRYVVKTALGQDAFKVYNTASPAVEQTGEAWPSGLNTGVTSPGFVWHAASSKFQSIDNVGKMRIHTGLWSTTAANMTKWISNTLAFTSRAVTVGITSASTAITFVPNTLITDDVGAAISGTGIPGGATLATLNPTAGTGTLSAAATATNAGLSATITREVETDQSPRSKLVMGNRYKMFVSTSDINSGGTNAPDRTFIYVGQSATDPGRAFMARQADPAFGVNPPQVAYETLVAPPGTFQPPATNEFIALGGTVQELVLADGTVVLDALGNTIFGITQTGSRLVTAAELTANTWVAITITFPVAFPVGMIPVVTPSYAPGALPAATVEVRLAAGSATNTGFTLYIWRNTATGTTVNYNATVG